MIGKSPLPYLDTKPQGAADFYFAINATFRFIRMQLGEEGLIRYWTDLGRDYMRPVWQSWKRDGLEGVARYWRAFFDAEPGSDVSVETKADEVVLHVRVCPLITHLRKGMRQIETDICRHCYYVSQSAAEHADMQVRIEGGAGSCEQHFYAGSRDLPPQDIDAIKKC